MTMVTRQLVGYDPNTQRAAFEFYIPPDRWNDVLSLVPNNKKDPYHIYNYAVDISVANDILGMAGEKTRVAHNLNYFLEFETRD
jgi:hypothetical protein